MSKTVWGIELGTHSIKAVKMLVGKEGLEIVDLEAVEVPPEDDELEQSREERLQTALETLRDSKEIKKSESIFISIPGHQTLNKLISVTLLDPGKFRETVQFEAQQQMPISLDDTIWDYQLVDRKPEVGQEVQVSLFVVRKEIVNTYLQLMDAAQLTVTGIQVAPLAIYNFIKFDQRFPKSGIVVDIGADNTDVVVIDENKIWIRTVPNGGNSITKALAARFKIPWEEAEKLKVKAAKSKQAQKIFGVMKPALRELLSEINRSIGFYKSQHPKVKLNYMLLMGAGSHLLGLKKFFEQQLQHRVDKLTHLKKLKLGRSANPATLQDNIASLGVAMGLAIQAADAAENRVNLVPPEIKVGTLVNQKFKFVAIAAMIMVLAAFLPMLNLGNPDEAQSAADSLRDVQNTARQQATELTQVRSLEPVHAEITRYSSSFSGYEVGVILEDAMREMMRDTGPIRRRLERHNSQARLDLSALAGGRPSIDRRTFRTRLGSAKDALGLSFDALDTNGDNRITAADLRDVEIPRPRSQPLFFRMGPVGDRTVEAAFFRDNRLSPGSTVQMATSVVTFPSTDLDPLTSTYNAFYRERVAGMQLEVALPIDNWDGARRLLTTITDDIEEQLAEKLEQRTAGIPNLAFSVRVNTRADTVDQDRAQLISDITGADAGRGQQDLVLNRYWRIYIVGLVRSKDPRIGRGLEVRGQNMTALFPQTFERKLSNYSSEQLRTMTFLFGEEGDQVSGGHALRLAVDEQGQPRITPEGTHIRVAFRPAAEGGSLPEIGERARIYAPTP